MSDSANSGIFVLEGPSSGQPIPARREPVVAFVGPAPRGPVDIPVAVRSVDEYLKRFGTPHRRSRLEYLLGQFFDNGGMAAIVVRVSRSARRHRLALPASRGALVLNALHPGPFEFLRASVDYDNIEAAENDRFNLVVHRLASPRRPLVVEQEIYNRVSIDAADPDFIGHALVNSELVTLGGELPRDRPWRTLGPGVEGEAAYVYGGGEWQDPDAPSDYDLIGSDAESTGVHALDQIASLDLLCMLTGVPGGELGPVALLAAERYCQRRHALLLIDPPGRWDCASAVSQDRLSAGYASPNIVTYFPRLASRGGRGGGAFPSALGAIAGALAAGDRVGGPWSLDVAAGLRLHCRDASAIALASREIRNLTRLGINPLLPESRGWMQLTSLVTLARGQGLDVEWGDLRMRRTTLFALGNLIRGTRWAAYQQNDAETRREVRQQIYDFLSALQQQGAFASRTAAGSFFVRCDESLNREYAGSTGTLQYSVGIALRQAYEFLSFRVEQTLLDGRVTSLGWRTDIALAS